MPPRLFDMLKKFKKQVDALGFEPSPTDSHELQQLTSKSLKANHPFRCTPMCFAPKMLHLFDMLKKFKKQVDALGFEPSPDGWHRSALPVSTFCFNHPRGDYLLLCRP